MFRKALISLVAVATIGTGLVAMTSDADAHRRSHHYWFLSLLWLPRPWLWVWLSRLLR